MNYKIILAGIPVYYSFIDESVSWYFGKSMCQSEENSVHVMRAAEKRMDEVRKQSGCSRQYAEFFDLLYCTSKELIPFGRVPFHAVAVKIGEDGYLIAAKSGVGKSTQYFNLKKLYGDDILIINGDKPLLEFRQDCIMIHPSPWKGKEDLGNDVSVKLKGIIFLMQDDHNEIERLDPQQAVHRCLRQLIYKPETVELIHGVCDMCRRLLNEIPLWLLKNKGDDESSQLLYETVVNEGIYE